ncbi:MAG TPA: universal stress protein [Thermoanaerobaculia bacterium]|nr:universal stress protein [Thermoanaerobaculia bacterium]
MIRKVLVATDFSETSEGALRWGVEIAREHEAELRLMHALRLPSASTPLVPIPPDLHLDMQQRAAARLEEVETRLREAGSRVSTEIRDDDPAQGIRVAAEGWGADLVVIGTRGLSGLEHLLLGSVAERVIAVSPCPVLSVHHGDYDRHRALRRILVPTDFSEEAQRSAELALELVGARVKGELILVHAYHIPVEYTAYGGAPTSVRFLEEISEAAKGELDRWAAELSRRGWKVTTAVEEGAPAPAIQRVAKDREVDLIAMGTHGRGGLKGFFLGSTAKRVVQHGPCPVLTVRHES